jgi:hypothetical protein
MPAKKPKKGKKARPRASDAKKAKATKKPKASGKQPRPRATDAEIAVRVQEVLNCRLSGAAFHDLQALAVEKGWKVGNRQLWHYVQLADEQMEQHFEEGRARLFRRHVLQRRRLYAMALQDGDKRTALAILKDEGDLLGLYPPKKTELTGPNGGPIETATVELTDDERAAAIAAILAHGAVGQASP